MGGILRADAINCVDFFLRIMIQAQDISSQLPTVGGDVHIAVIRKDGYHQVTKEVWQHQAHEVEPMNTKKEEVTAVRKRDRLKKKWITAN